METTIKIQNFENFQNFQNFFDSRVTNFELLLNTTIEIKINKTINKTIKTKNQKIKMSSNKMKKTLKYEGKTYNIKKNNTFWTNYTIEDHVKYLQKQKGLMYPTTYYNNKIYRVYDHSTDKVGLHTVDGEKFLATSYNYVNAAREFEIVYVDGKRTEVPREWSGRYFMSEYTLEDHLKNTNNVVNTYN